MIARISEHILRYKNVESLYRIPETNETNIRSYTNYA